MKQIHIKTKKKLKINSPEKVNKKNTIKTLKNYKGKVCLKIDLSILRNRKQKRYY
jgi:hypothetical protein